MILVNFLIQKHNWESLKEKWFMSIQQSTLLQIICKIIINFQVIAKTIKDPDDNFKCDSSANGSTQHVKHICNIYVTYAEGLEHVYVIMV